MKKALHICATIATAVSFNLAFADVSGDRLVEMSRRTTRILENRVYTLNETERGQVADYLRSIRRILRTEDYSTGYYCAAACKTSGGSAENRFTRGASANFELEAKQKAVESVRSEFSCAHGIIEVGCERVSSQGSYVSSATCKDPNGSPELRFQGLGEGSTELESLVSAYRAVLKVYSCSHGVTSYETSTADYRTYYCQAGCKNLDGSLDVRFSEGATGEGLIKAKFNSIQTVLKKYSCSHGVIVDRCE